MTKKKMVKKVFVSLEVITVVVVIVCAVVLAKLTGDDFVPCLLAVIAVFSTISFLLTGACGKDQILEGVFTRKE